VVDLRRGTIPGGDGDLIRFLPESLSFEGCVIALAACPGCDDPATDERSPDTGLRAVLGHGEDSVVAPDLVRDGPHALVAGTTGSGKSVLLTTWLTSLAAHRPPDRLRLILLDFKGGATFGSWQHDPHVEALVTDLNREDAQRVLEGIRHELTRREEVLRERGVADVCELPEQDRPARIVVVVDEFRLLAESVPSILQDLLRCATVGRSLGLHLILATQRPQGVVSAEIRANVSLTICLRLTSELDASDLIGATDPAHFSSTRPGTAALRSGAGPLQVFTVAQVDPGDGATVGATTSLACSIVVGPTCADIEELADAEDPPAAATHRMTATPETFIAPPLPLRLDRVCVPPDGAAPSDTAVLGLRATPSRLVPFKYAPHRDGSLTVEAAPGPQRNAMVSAWLDAFSRARWGQACVVLDGDGITTDETFPGLILGRDQLPDAAEAIRALAEGRTAGADGRAVLVITSPTAWFGTGTDSGAASFEDSVTALATTGRCPIVLVRGRESAGSRIAAQAPQHLYLPWSIPPESRMLWPSLRPCTPIPGRGVLLGPDTGDKGDPVHCLAQDSPSRPRHSRDGHPITGWVSLPTRVEGHALAVRSLDLAPLSWTPTSNCAAVLGGPGSGRTTTLLALHRVLEHSRLIPHNLLCTEPGGVNAPLSPTEDPQQWWLVDDLDDLPAAALNLLAERARSGGNLMVCSRFAGSVPARLTWWHQIDPRTGILLLKPRAADAALLGWRIVEEASAPPGRAWFFPPAAVTPVRAQIALAPGTGSGTGTERR
jgi:S-DNA-T family DNA segregation ATPase FtsK/SpoIIIE